MRRCQRAPNAAAAQALSLRSFAAARARSLSDVTGIRAETFVREYVASDLAAFGKCLRDAEGRRREAAVAATAHSVADATALSKQYYGVGPVQSEPEIAALIEMAAKNGASTVCEIGAHDAGTTILFSRVLKPDFLLVMDLYVKNRWRLRRDAPPGQRVRAVDGDSSHPWTQARARRKLGGRHIDLLLIDGDHSWDGVKRDFLRYRGLVRPGGLIAFHDICVSRPESGGWSGDVPAFWRLVRSLYPHEEFITDPHQDGLGIGVIRYSPAVPVSVVIETAPPST